MKKAIANAVLVLCSLFLFLLAGELTVRCFYPLLKNYTLEMWRYGADMKERHSYEKLPFSHFPNRKGFYYGAEIDTNSDGFRDNEYPKKRVPGKTRIMFLGDSFALGWAVPFDKTIAKVLERKLNEKDDRFEVINMGIGNYNTTMELELFKWKGLPYQPDAVVLLYFVNDPEPVPQLPALSYHLERHSYLLALLYDRVQRFRANRMRDLEWSHYYSSLYDPASPNLAANSEAVRAFGRLCRDRGIKLFIVSYPELHELKDYPFDNATRHIQGLASELKDPFLDLLPSFQSYEPDKLWVSNEDTHGNELASAVAAQAIFGWLQPQLEQF